MTETPTFALVIPTYNAEGTLERLLKSIQSQVGSTYSVAIVDQCSTDRTVEIARAYGCTVVERPSPRFYTPPGASRNVGARAVEGEILVHLDADMELGSEDFLSRLEDLIDVGHRAAIIREIDVATGFWAQCKALERACYYGTAMEAARVVTRELFCLVGGYDEDISSGEDFFVTRLYERETFVRADDSLSVFHHIGHPSLRSLLRKKFRYGRTARTYLRKARTVDFASGSVAWTSIRAYLKNWRLLASRPIHYLCIYPMRALEFAALELGMLLGANPSG